VCAAHAVEPDRMCQSCAGALYLTSGRAGKRLIVAGGMVVLLAAFGFLATIMADLSHMPDSHGRMHYKPVYFNGVHAYDVPDPIEPVERVPFVPVASLCGVVAALGFLMIAWGAVVAPRRAERAWREGRIDSLAQGRGEGRLDSKLTAASLGAESILERVADAALRNVIRH
jgi:hypothetical protein